MSLAESTAPSSRDPQILRAWRMLRRLPLLLWHFLVLLPLVLIALNSPLKRLRWRGETLEARLIRFWQGGLVRRFGFTLRVYGTPLREPHLLVANHSSWLDIELVHSQQAVGFVAKSEIERWPLIGWLATQGGTIYHRRGSGESLNKVAERVVERLRSGRSVGVFPEGTTTDGRSVRTFHARLFQTAIDAGVPVQPVALRFAWPDGSYASQIPFGPEESFLANFLRLLGEPNLIAEVHFLEPLRDLGVGRRALAEAARAAVASVIDGRAR
jgi:1-acyl-sn-glycerol-3-phosphate acyltransferase